MSPSDTSSRRLGRLLESHCARSGDSFDAFCSRSACGRSAGSVRRLARGEVACGLDVAVALVSQLAGELEMPRLEVLRQLLRPVLRPSDPVAQLMCASFWHPHRRRVQAPLALMRRHLHDQATLLVLDMGFPPFLFPPRLAGHVYRGADDAKLAVVSLWRRVHDLLLKRLEERGTEAAVLLPRAAVLALASLQGPFEGWSEGDRSEAAEHLLHDWRADRGLSLHLFDADRTDLPAGLSRLLQDNAAVLCVGDGLVFERPAGEAGWRWYERSADPPPDSVANEYISFQIARLDALRQWVREVGPPDEVESLLLPYVPRRTTRAVARSA
jgi:hypothetical protein